MGVMCSRFFVLVRSLAAEFWIIWSREIDFLQRPEYRLLQKSNLDEMKACITFSRSIFDRKGFILAIFRSW